MKKLALLFATTFLASQINAQCVADFSFTNNDPSVQFTDMSTVSAPFYYWDFGDGNTSYAQNPNHTYATNGLYLACLTVYDSLNGCSSTHCDSIVISNAAANCQANFSLADSAGYLYGFDASTGASSVEWYVYDNAWNTVYNGTSSNFMANVGAGTYYVCLYTYDAGGNWCDSTCNYHTVAGSGGSGGSCNVNFWVIDSAGYLYGEHQSTGTSSVEWYVFDANWNVVYNNTNSTLAYPAPAGTYTVCLYGYDSAGNWCDSTCTTVTTAGGGSNCFASFSWYPDSSGNGIYIYGNSVGSNLTYTWDFGDGNSSTQPNTQHTYTSFGTYLVCLTISDNAGCTDTYCDTIVVDSTTGGNLYVYASAPLSVNEVENVDVNVYPNPTNDIINLQINGRSDNYTVSIRSTVGQEVYRENLNTTFKTLDINHLSVGMYMLNIQNADGQILNTTKIIKQ